MSSELFSLNGTTISTTEYSITNDATYASGSNQTSDDTVVLVLDLFDMVKADELELRYYEKALTGSTVRLGWVQPFLGVQSTLYVSPPMIVLHGWDFSLKRIAGTDVTVYASVRSVT